MQAMVGGIELSPEQREMIDGVAPAAASEGEKQECLVIDWSERGFGFLQCADGRRAYCHAKAIGGGNLMMGETVMAVIKEDEMHPGKWAASEVERNIPFGLGQQQGAPSADSGRSKPPSPTQGVVAGGRLEGVVSEWNSRGFGFISFSDGRRAYVHHSEIGGGNLEQGETVIASVVEDSSNPGKWAAHNVQKVIVLPKSNKRPREGREGAQQQQQPPQQQAQQMQQMQQQMQQMQQQFQQQFMNPFMNPFFPMFCGGMMPGAMMSPAAGMSGGYGNMQASTEQQQQQQRQEVSGERHRGVVKEWSSRGFGFILLEDNRRVYVHHSSVADVPQGEKVNMDRGEVVSAIITQDNANPGKWAALDVRRVGETVQVDEGWGKGGQAAASGSSRPQAQQEMSAMQGFMGGCGGGEQSWNNPSFMEPGRVEGRVAEWSNRGFGFIIFADGRRAYVHHSETGGGNLIEGEAVTAVLTQDEKNPGKWAARDVQRIAEASSRSRRFTPPPSPNFIPGPPIPPIPLPPHLRGDPAHDPSVAHGERVEGVVAKWSDKGYGFINLADGRRAYVHASAIGGREMQANLDIGETVNVIVVEDPSNPGKWQARSLQRGVIGEDGVVSEWREEGGFGFVTMDDGRRVYIHHSSFGGGNLEVGQRLRVITRPDNRNPGKWCVAEIRSDMGQGGMNVAPELSATVLEWDPRGYGFVQTEDGRRVYVHHSAFGQGDLIAGEQVRVGVIPDLRNPGKFMASTLTRAGLGGLGELSRGCGSGLQMGLGELSTGETEMPQPQDWQHAKVAEWHDDRGYGFLELDDGRRVYVHHSAFGGGSLLHGQDCEAIATPDRLNPGKWRAASVRGGAVVPKTEGEPSEKRQRLD